MKALQNLTWDNLWKEIRLDLHYPVRIYGIGVSVMLLLQAFYQTQFSVVPSWILWVNGALAFGGAKLAERKTSSKNYLNDNSD